jgi:hypothetical protein
MFQRPLRRRFRRHCRGGARMREGTAEESGSARARPECTPAPRPQENAHGRRVRTQGANADALPSRARRQAADGIEERPGHCKGRGSHGSSVAETRAPKGSAALRFRAVGSSGRDAGGSEAPKRSQPNLWIQSLNPAWHIFGPRFRTRRHPAAHFRA